ncbi:MAG: right-handed parallel beta-helix repeat-containing protein [Chitinispirillaceae bacterium]|nr:right-handed parallel beta-helix repeat-containing protein [Chitinispirillaceae bacterium]
MISLFCTRTLRCAVIALGVFVAAPSVYAAGKSITVPSGKIKTIKQGLARAGQGDTVWVEPGVYRENLMVNQGITLKSRMLYKAVINGGKHGTVVSLARKTTISGFEIRNGTIGVHAKSIGISVSRCRIVNNWQTGIVCVRSLATIEDNVIAFNGGSGIQIYNVSATAGTINHNTIAYNGNHGIALGGNAPVPIENNIIAFNERFGILIKGNRKGLTIESNNVYGNFFGSPGPPAKNVAIDPEFASPRMKKDFAVKSKQLKGIKGSDNEQFGIRFIY